MVDTKVGKKSAEASSAKKRKSPVEDTQGPKGINKIKTGINNGTKTPVGAVSVKKAKDASVKAASTTVKSVAATASGTKESARSAIDDLFSGVSAAKKANQVAKVKKEQAEEKKRKKEEAVVQDDMGFLSAGSDGRKRTDEGFLIYTEDELKMNQGGDTELCPFDCDCCF